MDVRVEVKIEEIDEVIALFNKNFPILPSTKAEWLILDKAVDYSIDLTVDIPPGSFDGHISFGIYRPNDDMGYRTQVSCIRDHNLYIFTIYGEGGDILRGLAAKYEVSRQICFLSP